MLIFGIKSTFLESGILAVCKRELIIEEVHNGCFEHSMMVYRIQKEVTNE